MTSTDGTEFMPTPTSNEKDADGGPIVRRADEQQVRELAVEEIERKRRFRAIDAWSTHSRKPISEREIRREMERVDGRHSEGPQTSAERSR